MATEKPGFRSTFKQRFSSHHRGQIGKGCGGVKAASLEMSTRSLATRLKRLEFRSGPALERPQIEICLVDSKAKVLYKMRLGPGENQYFSVDDQPISEEEADRLSAASTETDLP
jgi:hypothetical protein